ncbi:MAG: HAMP domain-containing histidine kinase [Planctomycetes bacterium]|nr:HAMP domain-containing histidine kinase [Planctomycetota bacterium]
MLEILKLLCPYPHVDQDRSYADGIALPQPRVCHKCKARDCWSHVDRGANADLVHGVCPTGMSVVLCRFPSGLLLCNGLIVKQLNGQCPPPIRKKYQSHKVAWDEVAVWHRNLTRALPLIEEVADKKAQEAIHGLHDVKTAVSLVTRNAEAIIGTLPGDSAEERIENAPDEIKSLLKSVQLLHTRLSASSILANPEAASHGQKHRTPVHKVCYKMVRLFQELAAARGVRIKMLGTSYEAPDCYDSFETVPLVLIDNAVKYSEPGREVTVTVQDMHACVSLKVESYGQVVPESMRKAIFQRGTRGPDAHRRASSGSGLGLYIASVVAEAHGFAIRYDCEPSSRSGSSGKNTFWCDIPLDPDRHEER